MIPGLSGFAPDVAVDSAPIGISGSVHAAAEGSWLPSAAARGLPPGQELPIGGFGTPR